MITIAFLPLISAIITISLGFFVFLTNKESKINKLFLFFSISIALGLFSTFMMFKNSGDLFTVLFWDRMVYVGVVFIPVTMYHFGLAVLRKEDSYSKALLQIGYIVAFFFLVMIPTNFFVSEIFIYKWGAHMKAQFLHHFFLLYFFSYLVLWSVFMYKGYQLETGTKEKIKLRLISLSFLILTTVGSLGFLPAYEIPIYPFSYISGIIFVIILSYAILKYQLFNIKLILVEMALTLLNLFLFLNIFTSSAQIDFILNISVMITILFLSIALMRGIYKDIADREKISALVYDKEVANDRLQAMEQQKTEFVSIASHQLRTPLTVIKGYAAMILEGTFGEMGAPVREAIGKLYKASEKMASIVEDLLTVSRIEQGRMSLVLKKVNLVTFVQDVFSSLVTEISEAGINVAFASEERKQFFVDIDAEKMRQVILHILDNAIKHTPQQGMIQVALSRENFSGKVRITISDTGTGMEPSQINEVFDHFNTKVIIQTQKEGGMDDEAQLEREIKEEQEESTPRETGKISGIGLYLAEEIIDAHHGVLHIESAGKNTGTTVVIELPHSKDE